MLHSLSIGAAISEIIVYIAYVSYLIYRPIKSFSMKKKLDTKHTLIKNPASLAAFALPKFTLILSLPSIFVLLFISDSADALGILIYLAIFIFFIGLSLKLLFAAKGDYYLDEYGIRFLRNENWVIYYNDIEESKWFARNYFRRAFITEVHVTSITKMVVKGRKISIYNLSEKQYENNINYIKEISN